MSDILKDSSKVQMNFKIYDFCQGGYCEKSLSIELNDIQINESENDQIIAGDLFLSKAKSNHIIYLEFTLLGIQANTNYIRNKIGRVKNFEDLESLFNKTKTANNGNDISGDIRAQSYLEIIQFTINLAIKNCFGQDKCTDDYEIGVIANEEFYSLDQAQILTTLDILNFKTLHYNKFFSDITPKFKQFNISETLDDGECEFRKETDETFALNCDFNGNQ